MAISPHPWYHTLCPSGTDDGAARQNNKAPAITPWAGERKSMNGTFQTLDEAREYFQGDRFAMNSGITLDELTDEGCVCSMTLCDDHRNANGGVMGGALFTLADFAFAVLSNHLHRPTVAQQVSVNFISAPKGVRLFATARCRKNGRTSCVINVDVSDDAGRDIAQFVGTGFKLA